MLILSRKKEEQIVIGDDISITILDVRRARVRIGIDAPVDIPICRKELHNPVESSEHTPDIIP